MPQVIKLKRSSVPGQVPAGSQLALGEIAINTADGRMFMKKDDGVTTAVQEMANLSQDANFAAGLTVAGNAAVNGNTTLGNNSADVLSVNAASDFNASVNIDGALTTTGSGTFGDAAGDSQIFNGNVTLNNSLTVQGGTALNGNVTLGNTSADVITIHGTATFSEPAVFSQGVTTVPGQSASFSGNVNLGDGDDTINVNGVEISEYISDTVGAMVTSNTENGIVVTYQDADNTLDFDVQDFTITLTGDVAGSGTVTDLANVSIATTVQANSVALGTDTTGDYVQRLTAGNGISVSVTSGEGQNPTVAMTGSYTGNFTASGTVTASSDSRLKENVVTVNNALEKVSNMRGVYFDKDETRQLGVIAQEVEDVLPEVVFDNEDGYKSVAYGNIVGVLIEAIKELKEEINTLKGV